MWNTFGERTSKWKIFLSSLCQSAFQIYIKVQMVGAPLTHLGDSNRVSGSGFHPDTVLALTGILGMNLSVQKFFVSLSLFGVLPFHELNKYLKYLFYLQKEWVEEKGISPQDSLWPEHCTMVTFPSIFEFSNHWLSNSNWKLFFFSKQSTIPIVLSPFMWILPCCLIQAGNQIYYSIYINQQNIGLILDDGKYYNRSYDFIR